MNKNIFKLVWQYLFIILGITRHLLIFIWNEIRLQNKNKAKTIRKSFLNLCNMTQSPCWNLIQPFYTSRRPKKSDYAWMSSLFQHQIKLRRRMWMKKYYMQYDVLSSLAIPTPWLRFHHPSIGLLCCEHICSWEPKMNDEAKLKANIDGAQNIYRSISYCTTILCRYVTIFTTTYS